MIFRGLSILLVLAFAAATPVFKSGIEREVLEKVEKCKVDSGMSQEEEMTAFLDKVKAGRDQFAEKEQSLIYCVTHSLFVKDGELDCGYADLIFSPGLIDCKGDKKLADKCLDAKASEFYDCIKKQSITNA